MGREISNVTEKRPTSPGPEVVGRKEQDRGRMRKPDLGLHSPPSARLAPESE